MRKRGWRSIKSNHSEKKLGREWHDVLSLHSPRLKLESKLPIFPQLMVSECLWQSCAGHVCQCPSSWAWSLPSSWGPKIGPRDLGWPMYSQLIYSIYRRKSLALKRGVMSITADHYCNRWCGREWAKASMLSSLAEWDCNNSMSISFLSVFFFPVCFPRTQSRKQTTQTLRYPNIPGELNSFNHQIPPQYKIKSSIIDKTEFSTAHLPKSTHSEVTLGTRIFPCLSNHFS